MRFLFLADLSDSIFAQAFSFMQRSVMNIALSILFSASCHYMLEAGTCFDFIFSFTLVNAIEMFIRCLYLFEIFSFLRSLSLSDCQWICM